MPATVRCARCGATNRVDPDKSGQGLQPVCGRCKALLSPGGGSHVVDVTDARFDEEVLGSALPVLLDVWARWCAPCRGMEPVIEDLAQSLAGRVRLAKLDVDRNPASVARLRIEGVPTLILFKNGREVSRMIGARGKGEILAAVSGVA